MSICFIPSLINIMYLHNLGSPYGANGFLRGECCYRAVIPMGYFSMPHRGYRSVAPRFAECFFCPVGGYTFSGIINYMPTPYGVYGFLRGEYCYRAVILMGYFSMPP